jgi:hypothetical protein
MALMSGMIRTDAPSSCTTRPAQELREGTLLG